MPHTQRRHRRGQRREAAPNGETSASADDGWTHVPRRRLGAGGPAQTASYSTTALAAMLSAATIDHYDETTGTALDRVLGRLTIPQHDLYTTQFTAGNLEALDDQSHSPMCQPDELLERLQTFRESKAFEALSRSVQAIINASGLKHESPKTGRITKGVCIGLGSPSGLPNYFFGLESSLCQVAVFLELAAHFEKLSVSETAREGHDPDTSNRQLTLDLVAQDPVFNAVDKSFLENYCGMRVLDSPAAFDEIDEHSFVFAPHFPVYSWSASMRNSGCPLLIANSVESYIDNVFDPDQLRSIFRKLMPEGDSVDDKIPDLHTKQELQRFLSTHESIAVPNEGGPPTYRIMNDTYAYWRKDDSE